MMERRDRGAVSGRNGKEDLEVIEAEATEVVQEDEEMEVDHLDDLDLKVQDLIAIVRQEQNEQEKDVHTQQEKTAHQDLMRQEQKVRAKDQPKEEHIVTDHLLHVRIGLLQVKEDRTEIDQQATEPDELQDQEGVSVLDVTLLGQAEVSVTVSVVTM